MSARHPATAAVWEWLEHGDGSDKPEAIRKAARERVEEIDREFLSWERVEGDRCEVCGFWWWNDGAWHSLEPRLAPEETRWTRCSDHYDDDWPTTARSRVENGQTETDR